MRSTPHPSPAWPFRSSPATVFIGPFLVFMVLLEAIRFGRVENHLLPWWRQFPEHWGYPLQTVLCLGLIVLWRRHYPAPRWRGSLVASGMGLFGIVIWLLPPVLHELTGLGDGNPWLEAIGFRARLDGFDPGVIFTGEDSAWGYALGLGMRFLRLVVVVPLVEEIFWRGFLMRFLSDREGEWYRLPMERCDLRSILLTALAFGFAHWGPDFVPALIFGGLAGWVARWTGNLWAVVLMHAVANLSLGLFILSTEWWGLW
jgi:CAAX prenyl protease-like protein